MNKKKRLKAIPQLESDEAAERFVDEADLSEYDLSAFKPTHFEFEKKDSIVNLRVSRALLRAVKAIAHARRIPYQRLIREGMEKVVEVHPSGVTRPSGGKVKFTHSSKTIKAPTVIGAAHARKRRLVP